MSLFSQLEDRPTGFMIPDRKPLMVMDEETEMSHLNEYHTEIWRTSATFHIEYAVPHRDSLRSCVERARAEIAGLVLRDYYEQAQRASFAMYELRKALPMHLDDDARKALHNAGNAVTHMVDMLSPLNNVR